MASQNLAARGTPVELIPVTRFLSVMLLIEASRLLAFDHLKPKENQTGRTKPGPPCVAVVARLSAPAKLNVQFAARQLRKSNAPARPVADRETMRFARAVLDSALQVHHHSAGRKLLRFPAYVAVERDDFGRSCRGFPGEVLIAYGAKLNLLINEQHQWWRFVTPMFVHVNLLHLLVNMYSLWIVGPYVEKLYGSAKFVVFWVVTGVAGVVASYLTVMSPDTQLGRLGRFLFKTMTFPRRELQERCLDWSAFFLFLELSFVTSCRKGSNALLAPACCR